MVNLILQEQQDKGRAWSTSCQDEELDPPLESLLPGAGARQAVCPRHSTPSPL